MKKKKRKSDKKMIDDFFEKGIGDFWREPEIKSKEVKNVEIKPVGEYNLIYVPHPSEKITSIKFEEIFNDNDLKILRDIDSPVIDNKNNFLLGQHSKGAIVAWVQVMKLRGKGQKLSDEILAKMLNEKIKRLDISARTLRELNTTAYNKYYKEFLRLTTPLNT